MRQVLFAVRDAFECESHARMVELDSINTVYCMQNIGSVQVISDCTRSYKFAGQELCIKTNGFKTSW